MLTMGDEATSPKRETSLQSVRRASLLAKMDSKPPSMTYPEITSSITRSSPSGVVGVTSPNPSVVKVTML